MKAMSPLRLASLTGLAVLLLLLASGCGKSPYDNPIANNSQQPDKILFDKAVENIERHRYELARITLQTLINTYPDSCLLYTSPSPRDRTRSRMPSSA